MGMGVGSGDGTGDGNRVAASMTSESVSVTTVVSRFSDKLDENVSLLTFFLTTSVYSMELKSDCTS